MPVTFESIRFGTVEVDEEAVIEFPHGLIGLGGLRYTLLDRNPGTGFLWLHSVDDPALALPVVNPYAFFGDFAIALDDEDLERVGLSDAQGVLVYVTVRTAADPFETTANLRAPLLVHEGRGFQLINRADGAALQTPLFDAAGRQVAEPARSADAA